MVDTTEATIKWLPFARNQARKHAIRDHPLLDEDACLSFAQYTLWDLIRTHDPAKGSLPSRILTNLPRRMFDLKRQVFGRGQRIHLDPLDKLVERGEWDTYEGDAIRTANTILTGRERTVITAVYILDRQQADVATELGISRAHTGRIHRAALTRLRTHLLATGYER